MPSVRVKLWRELNEALEKHGDPACRENPDLFDLDLYTDPTTKRIAEKAAKEVCLNCPVRFECAGYAMAAGEEAMVWGALTPAEREAIKINNKLL